MILASIHLIMMSPSTRKVWIEIENTSSKGLLKYLSPSTRKVWIEIVQAISNAVTVDSHLPHGRCGLKCPETREQDILRSHLPHGRCGLKSIIV